MLQVCGSKMRDSLAKYLERFMPEFPPGEHLLDNQILYGALWQEATKRDGRLFKRYAQELSQECILYMLKGSVEHVMVLHVVDL